MWMNENGRETSKKTLCPPVPAQKELTNQYLLSDEVVLITLLEFIVLYSGICGQPRQGSRREQMQSKDKHHKLFLSLSWHEKQTLISSVSHGFAKEQGQF